MIDENMIPVRTSDFLGEDNTDKLRAAINIIDLFQQKMCELSKFNKDETRLKALRGGTALVWGVINKVAVGKMPRNFDKEDWCDVLQATCDRGIMMDPQDYTIAVFKMYADYIRISSKVIEEKGLEEEAQKICVLADEIEVKIEELRLERIRETVFVEDCLWISLEAMVKLISSYLSLSVADEYGQLIRAVSTFGFEYGRLILYSREQRILEQYLENQYKLDEKLQAEYEAYLEELSLQAEHFNDLIRNAFEPDLRNSLIHSIELARIAGVSDNEILDSVEKIDEFFMN